MTARRWEGLLIASAVGVLLVVFVVAVLGMIAAAGCG